MLDARRGRSSEKKEAKAVEYDTTFSTFVCINTFLEIESFLFFFLISISVKSTTDFWISHFLKKSQKHRTGHLFISCDISFLSFHILFPRENTAPIGPQLLVIPVTEGSPTASGVNRWQRRERQTTGATSIPLLPSGTCFFLSSCTMDSSSSLGLGSRSSHSSLV